MSKPSIAEITGGFLFTWEQEYLTIKVSRLHNHSSGKVTGELLIQTTAPGYNPHLHRATFNFSDSEPRRRLAKQLAENYTEVDSENPLNGWKRILEQVCVYTLDNLRRGEPACTITSEDKIDQPRFLLDPIIPLGHPTIIFGEGGAAKSYLALLFAIATALPWEDNPLSLIPDTTRHKPFYLDWELSREAMTWRLKQLTLGHGLGYMEVGYRFCSLPLADDLDSIRDILAEAQTDFVIIDSLGLAAGGDLNSPESALRFFSALRQLHITSLIVAHTSKDFTTSRKSVFGSVFFRNSARSIEEVKTIADGNKLNIGLFHDKANLNERHPPIGIRLDFRGRESVKASSCEVNLIPELARGIPLKTRALALLKRGAMSSRELQEELEIEKEKEDSFYAQLSTWKKKGWVLQLPNNTFCLPTTELEN